MSFAPALSRFQTQSLSIFIRRGLTRTYSTTREQTSESVPLGVFEANKIERNKQRPDDVETAHSSQKERRADTNTGMATYQVIKDPFPFMDNSGRFLQSSSESHKVFTTFLDQLEDDGYTAYSQQSPYDDATHRIHLPEIKPEISSIPPIPEIHTNGEGQAQDFAGTLHHTDRRTKLEQQTKEARHFSIQEDTQTIAATIENKRPLRIGQTINLCLHLDDKVTRQLDKIVAKYSQYSLAMNNGRSNVAVIKGLPAQNWRQYQVYMRLLQNWRAPIHLGKVKPFVRQLTRRRWEVVWRIQDVPEILAMRQNFRQVLKDHLPEYNFPPDAPFETGAVITRDLNRYRSQEVVDTIDATFPDGIDLGVVTRCVLVHTIFSYSKIQTTVTQSPEFPLMGVESNQLSHDDNVESVWNRVMSQVDTEFFKSSKSGKFYKTAPKKRT